MMNIFGSALRRRNKIRRWAQQHRAVRKKSGQHVVVVNRQMLRTKQKSHNLLKPQFCKH